MGKKKKKNPEIVRIIACGVFKPALEHLKVEERYPNVRITYLESNLHVRPQELQEKLLQQFEAAEQAGERAICLYGNCIAGINDLCEEHGVLKVPGEFCHDILLGPERFQQFIEETAGTYFMEQEIIDNFDMHCREPLELDDEVMRRYCFEHYKRVMYVRQPSDRSLTRRVSEIADFLELELEIQDADYSYLEKNITDLMER